MNNTVIYLAKGDKQTSALLKRRAVEDYFGYYTEICTTEKGKPVFSELDGYGISVSHSGGIIAVVISRGNVGIDVQERKELKSNVKAFFHESEQNCEFYDLWVRKEAWGKLTGDGIFHQKGKKLPEGLIFYDISPEVTAFANVDFSAVICVDKEVQVEFRRF